MKGISAAVGLSVAMMFLAGTALAKGGVEEITVSGPSLKQSIEINDPQILDQFNPWGGLHRFLSERLEDHDVNTDTLDGPYQVRFFQSLHEWVYEFSYYTDGGHEPGYILLPEPPASSFEGFAHPAGWYRSTAAWSEVMSERLEGLVTPTEAESGIARSLPQLLLFVSAIVLLGLAVVIRRHVREREVASAELRPGLPAGDPN
jgi:hypothetical protein